MRRIALTRELIARAFPSPLADDGWTIPLRDDAELGRLLDAQLAGKRERNEVWIFAYGSLMWKPDFAFDEVSNATINGWHRRFCLWQRRYRGSRERPNLMLALDEGGACHGMAYRLDGPDLKQKLFPVWKREMIAFGYEARWVEVLTGKGMVQAIAFTAWREGPRYAGRLADDEVATTIVSACGHVGPGAEYLLETAAKCAELGIEDEHLFRIEALVARKLADNQ